MLFGTSSSLTYLTTATSPPFRLGKCAMRARNATPAQCITYETQLLANRNAAKSYSLWVLSIQTLCFSSLHWGANPGSAPCHPQICVLRKAWDEETQGFSSTSSSTLLTS